ncbi:MAG TPA: LLM class flavin-dependent oxidoreductase, partial [Chloroflexota bacterium]|nr:LLM class flavin-dependent oxidoreductase [Chloroflexota bacterium]
PGEDRLLYPFPGRQWDPQVGLEQYHDHLEYLQRADDLGFDGICLTEHHYTVHGLPSPNIMAGAVAVKTSNVKIVLMGNCVPLHGHPVRLAEELAMVDVLSRGRLVAGMLRGGFMEWYSFSIDGVTARERFEEAWELIEACWTEPEPFEWNGKHFHYENISITPRPIQKPHPPLAMAASTAESIEWCVNKRVPMASSFAPTESMRENFAYYRKYAAEQHDWHPGPENFMFSRQLYVAPTTRQAREEADPHLIEFFEEIPVARKFPEQIERYRAMSRTDRSFDYKQGKVAGAQFLGESMGGDGHGPNIDKLIEDGLVIVGDPEEVTCQILHQRERLGADTMMIYSPFATLPVSMATKSMELFAKEVLPNLR